MKLSDLFHSVSWPAVEIVLSGHYDITTEEFAEKHHKVFDRCLVLEPASNNMTIRIRVVEDIFDDEKSESIDVVATDGSLFKDRPDFEEIPDNDPRAAEMVKIGLKPTKGDDLVEYAIEFQPWQEWLGMEVSAETLEKFSPEEVIAHCIWEMTFIGFDEPKIQGEKDRLDKMVEDIKAGKVIGKTFDSAQELFDDLMLNRKGNQNANEKDEGSEEDDGYCD